MIMILELTTIQEKANVVADALSHKKYCNATFAQRMPPELRREIKYLNLGMVNEAKVVMEIEPALEAEIREGQLGDAKLKEIRQLIRDNKTSDSQKIAKVPYG
jgi:hypothetical protein